VVLLDPVEELDLGYLGVLFGYPWVACVAGAGDLQVSAHWWVDETGGSALDVVDFHYGNTT